jgi:hypothetical protein
LSLSIEISKYFAFFKEEVAKTNFKLRQTQTLNDLLIAFSKKKPLRFCLIYWGGRSIRGRRSPRVALSGRGESPKKIPREKLQG